MGTFAGTLANMHSEDETRAELLACAALPAELLALFESLVNVMFCAKDASGFYVEVNSAFVRRTGKQSKRDVIGRRASDLFARERADLYEEQDQRVISGEGSLVDELELIRRPDGDLGWYLTTKRSVASYDGHALGLVSVSRDLQVPGDEAIGVASLQPLISHVRANLGEPLRSADLAAVVGCSADQLDRRVRRVFGLSPKQYVLRVKVERAIELLSTTDASLADVAHSAGFYDQPDFSRRFVRATGRTPAEFRALGMGSLG